MKKMSLMKLLESDILNKNQQLKFSVMQELPGYIQTFMKQIKADKYRDAVMTLDALIDTAKKIQVELNRQLSSSPEIGNSIKPEEI